MANSFRPLVSVVVPVYNVENYLDRCVLSILNQTHHQLQVILVNDGSTDTSGLMCDQHRKDPRVEVIHQPNGGLSRARNAGLDASLGEYVTFVDADDWIAQDFVASLLALCEQHNADIASAALFRTAGSEPDPRALREDVMVFDKDTTLKELNGALHTKLTVACAKLYRTRIFLNIKFPPDRLHEDEFTTYKALAASERVVVTSRPLYFYWQRTDSITGSRPTERNWLDVLDAYRERQDFLEKHASPAAACLGRVELFRKLLHYRQWLDNSQEDLRRSILPEMRSLASSIWACSSLRVRVFCAAYTRAPLLMDQAHAVALRLRRARLRNARNRASVV